MLELREQRLRAGRPEQIDGRALVTLAQRLELRIDALTARGAFDEAEQVVGDALHGRHDDADVVGLLRDDPRHATHAGSVGHARATKLVNGPDHETASQPAVLGGASIAERDA